MLKIKAVQDYDCDVLIAGGGPSGSCLAFHLAKRGIKVIVVESEVFPRDKVCGDGVSPIALAELKKLGITELGKFRKTNEISHVGLFIKNDKVSIPLTKPDHLPFHAHIIPRIDLDFWISNAAKKAGAKYVEGTRVLDYKINATGVSVCTKQGLTEQTLRAKMIVGADGSSSRIYRQLNGTKPNGEYQLLGLRAYYEKVNGPTDRVDVYFSEEGFPGIFWMFPRGKNAANIGMAMVSDTFPKKNLHVKELLQRHIDGNKDIKERIGAGRMVGKIQGWPINFYNNKSVICSDRILLVGDAAGLINPLSGDGIQYSLLSADWAGEVIFKAFENEDFSEKSLSAYRSRVERELGLDFSLSNLLVQFPRNKTLGKLWMGILEVLIARAKKDKEYADIIAGIFEGTYPSYKAANLSFVLKSLKEGGLSISEYLAEGVQHPQEFLSKLVDRSNGALELVSELLDHRDENLKWVKTTAGRTVSLVGQMVKHLGQS